MIMMRLGSVSKFMALLVCMLILGIGGEAEAAPGKAAGIRQVGDDAASVEVSWNLSREDVSGYQIEYCENHNFSGNTYGCKSVGAQADSIQISGLLPGKSYYVRVSALDKEGNPGISSDILEAVTAPWGKAEELRQTDADKNFLSFSWRKSQGANVYRVDWIDYLFAEESWGFWTQEVIGDVSSYKLPASEHKGYSVCVYAGRKSASGYVAYSDESPEEYMGIFLRPLPGKVTGVRMFISGIPRFYPEEGFARFGWDCEERAEGYQYVVYGHNGKKLFSKTTKDYINVEVKNKKLTNDQFMEIKVRGYITLHGEKRYGEWSDSCYFAKRPRNVNFLKISNGRLKMTWSKTKGAENYTIYASRKQNSGYKKLGTTSKNSYIITKVNGRKLVPKKVYFFKITANRKVGKKTFSSDGNWYFSRIY